MVRRCFATLVSGLLVATACSPDSSVEAETPVPASAPVSVTDPSTGTLPPTTATTIPPMTTVVDDGWRWLLPTTPPLQLTLAAGTVEPSVDCPESVDCIGPATLRTASLDYRTPGTPASVSFHQVEVGDTPLDPPIGTEATIAGRRIRVVEGLVTGTGYAAFELAWNERPNLAVRVEAFGLSRTDLEAFVAGLVPASQRTLEDLVATAPQPEEPCVGPAQLLAPTVVPAGWQRFVLSAQPLDACSPAPVLALSLVNPGAAMVTIITRLDTGGQILPGQPAQMGRRTVRIERGEQPALDSAQPRPTARVFFSEAELVVELSATNVADEELASIVDGIAPVDAPTWATIVAAVQPARAGS